MKNFYSLFLLLVGLSCQDDNSDQNDQNQDIKKSITQIPYQLIKTMPHDTNSFIEGLEYYKGEIYESSAFVAEFPNTTSSIGKVNPETGEVNKKIVLNKHLYFSEGITILQDKIFHVTYKNQKGFVYDAKSYRLLREFTYENKEGWGLTNDGTNLIMSDGTDILTFFDPNTLEVVRRLSVKENGVKIKNLNELEYIHNYIYANIYTLDQIAKINPITGEIEGILDLTNLKKDATNRFPKSIETNGIAFNPIDSTILVTGKLWPTYYKIKIAL
jgi:glutamine cyclotransferase